MTSYDRLHHSSIECERDLICSPDLESPGPSLALPEAISQRLDWDSVEQCLGGVADGCEPQQPHRPAETVRRSRECLMQESLLLTVDVLPAPFRS